MTTEKLLKELKRELIMFKYDGDFYIIRDEESLNDKIEMTSDEFKDMFKISNIESIGCYNSEAKLINGRFEIEYNLYIHFKNHKSVEFVRFAIFNNDKCRCLK